MLLIACACSAPPPPSNPLVGTWLLERVVAKGADGSIDEEPYGAAPSGYLTYTSDGRMQVILSFSDRARLSSDWRTSPLEERAAAFATSLSYAGRYSVSDGRVVHHVEVSSDPNRVGTDLERVMRLEGNRLQLSTPPLSTGGVVREFTLTWVRAPAAAATERAP